MYPRVGKADFQQQHRLADCITSFLQYDGQAKKASHHDAKADMSLTTHRDSSEELIAPWSTLVLPPVIMKTKIGVLVG